MNYCCLTGRAVIKSTDLKDPKLWCDGLIDTKLICVWWTNQIKVVILKNPLLVIFGLRACVSARVRRCPAPAEFQEITFGPRWFRSIGTQHDHCVLWRDFCIFDCVNITNSQSEFSIKWWNFPTDLTKTDRLGTNSNRKELIKRLYSQSTLKSECPLKWFISKAFEWAGLFHQGARLWYLSDIYHSLVFFWNCLFSKIADVWILNQILKIHEFF